MTPTEKRIAASLREAISNPTETFQTLAIQLDDTLTTFLQRLAGVGEPFTVDELWLVGRRVGIRVSEILRRADL